MRARYGSGGMFMIDMHGTLARADRVEQLAHAGGAVLRLLHREHHQVVLGRIDRAGHVGGELARQLARIDLDQAFAALAPACARAPFALMSSASAGRHTSFTAWPAATSLMASSDP